MGGFDIDICERVSNADVAKATRMFQRRRGRQKYLQDSGGTSVRSKQAIRETQQSVHEFATILVSIAGNLHRGFHDICQPIRAPIDRYHEIRKREEVSRERVNRQRASEPAPELATPHLRAK